MMTVDSNSLAIWSWLSAALLTILAATLTLSPRLLLFLSETAVSLTSLEAFLALHFGLFLAALALTLVLNVCCRPLFPVLRTYSSQVPSPKPPVPSDEVPSHPLLTPLTVATNISAFLAWNTKDVGALASIVFFISMTIGLWGLWTASDNKLCWLLSSVLITSRRLFSQIPVPFQKRRALTNTRPPSSLATRPLLRRRKRSLREGKGYNLLYYLVVPPIPIILSISPIPPPNPPRPLLICDIIPVSLYLFSTISINLLHKSTHVVSRPYLFDRLLALAS